METPFESLLLQRLDDLDKKLDHVRTKDLPNLKTEMAVLITENKAHSKLHSMIGSIAAITISALIGQWKIK
jgi:hypothetical protein